MLIYQMIDLASLKSESDKLDIDKLETTQVNFKKIMWFSRQKSC